MITAEEFLNKDYFYIILDIRESPINPTDISQVMIEFAKLHVEAALKKAYNNIEYTLEDSSVPYVVENSILNAYPLENIK